MIECLVSFSTWVEGNSGQFQIGIALIALTYAWKAYRKVLDQIDLSNRQTELTITQMTKYNEERVFENRIRISELILKQIEELMSLRIKFSAAEIQYSKLDKIFKFSDSENNKDHENEKELLDLNPKFFRDKLNINRNIVKKRLEYLDELFNKIDNEQDNKNLEHIMNEIYKFYKIQDDLRHDIDAFNANLDNLEKLVQRFKLDRFK